MHSYHTSARVSQSWLTLGLRWRAKPSSTNARSTVCRPQASTLRTCKSFWTIWGSSSRSNRLLLVYQKRWISSLELRNRSSRKVGCLERMTISPSSSLTPRQRRSLSTHNWKRFYRRESKSSILMILRLSKIRQRLGKISSNRRLYRMSSLRVVAWCSNSPSTCKPLNFSYRTGSQHPSQALSSSKRTIKWSSLSLIWLMIK